MKLIHSMVPVVPRNITADEIFHTMGDSFETDDGKMPKLDINFEPTEKDLGELRYSFYIHNGLDAINIRPIDTSWLNNIWINVPQRLRQSYPELSADLSDEVCDGYRMAVKKAMVDFVLHEPDKYSKAQLDSGPRGDDVLRKVPKPWRPDVLKAKRRLLKHLHAANPVLAYLNMVWRAVFSNLRYVDCYTLGEQKDAFTLRYYRDTTKHMIDDVRGLLFRKWIKGIQSTLIRVNCNNELMNLVLYDYLMSYT